VIIEGIKINITNPWPLRGIYIKERFLIAKTLTNKKNKPPWAGTFSDVGSQRINNELIPSLLQIHLPKL